MMVKLFIICLYLLTHLWGEKRHSTAFYHMGIPVGVSGRKRSVGEVPCYLDIPGIVWEVKKVLVKLLVT